MLTATCASTDTISLEAAIAANSEEIGELRQYVDSEYATLMDLVADVRRDEAVIAKLQELIEELTARVAALEGGG